MISEQQSYLNKFLFLDPTLLFCRGKRGRGAQVKKFILVRGFFFFCLFILNWSYFSTSSCLSWMEQSVLRHSDPRIFQISESMWEFCFHKILIVTYFVMNKISTFYLVVTAIIIKGEFWLEEQKRVVLTLPIVAVGWSVGVFTITSDGGFSGCSS